MKDAEWIAELLCHVLLRSSLVPPEPIRELRDLTRYRRKLVESQVAERNRLLKLLESANIKLASVAAVRFWPFRSTDAESPDRRKSEPAGNG